MKLKTLIAALAAAGMASSALAAGQVDDKPASKDEGKPEKMARVEVTGSSLKRINAETASPVQVVDVQ